MGLEKIVLFAALLAVGYAEVVEIRPCDDSNDDVCKVGQVSIDPCPGGKTCVFKRGSDASLSFDFTPNFATSSLKTMVYWNNGALLPFVGFGSDDACTYTSCPTVASQSQTLNYNLHVGRKLPPGKYPLIWKVWNPDNVDQQCCFQFTIRLLQKKV